MGIVNDNWLSAKKAYIDKDKGCHIYYLTNACGQPHIDAKRFHKWPGREVISDDKTSAGMDRTDDIKKGIYQTIKMGINYIDEPDYKTAPISNLPSYRHGCDYVEPMSNVLWGIEGDMEVIDERVVWDRRNLRYLFDYIITLESPLLRDLEI